MAVFCFSVLLLTPAAGVVLAPSFFRSSNKVHVATYYHTQTREVPAGDFNKQVLCYYAVFRPWSRVSHRKTSKKISGTLGISQAELAQMAGVSLATLVKIEGGQNTNPRIATLASIAHELDTSVDALLDLR